MRSTFKTKHYTGNQGICVRESLPEHNISGSSVPL